MKRLPTETPRRLGRFARRLVLCGLPAILAAPSWADTLVTDISNHQIAITSSFTGTDLLLFGAIARDPTDAGAVGTPRGFRDYEIAVVIRGPLADTEVRKKQRIAGIWVNTDSMLISKAPSYYAVLSTRPLAEIASEPVLERHQIGVNRLRLSIPESRRSEGEAYKSALIRNKQSQGLYTETSNEIAVLGDTLFRTMVHFPANVPVGNYRAEVYLFRAGAVVSAQTTPLFINKSGDARMVYRFAHETPALYGLTAVLVALMAGWIAAAVFRRS